MSYTVEVAATVMGSDFDPVHPSGPIVYVTTFAGGHRGRMVQLSFGFASMACLTMEQLDSLIDVLTHARDRSLADYPKNTAAA